ncbi:MAG TPA: hypothetical protein PKC89_04915 [Pyrinomonadaceae bacterium]|nr:hypothetical protein [Pyrinomonadaceae bacterium]
MEVPPKVKIRKPTGIFIVCGLVFLNFGLYQFIQDFMAMRNAEVETPVIITALIIGLDVLCALSAIWTLLGDNAGRISMLAFLSLNMLWSVFVLIFAISKAEKDAAGYYDASIFVFGFSLLKPLFLLGLSWWYFTQQKVVAYYKQDNNYGLF